jgi:hypothetical protein
MAVQVKLVDIMKGTELIPREERVTGQGENKRVELDAGPRTKY